MSSYTPTYTRITTLGDFGPWVSKLVLRMPSTVRSNDINEHSFNVFCSRREPTGDVLMRRDHGSSVELPSEGYVQVKAAYPCDETGRRSPEAQHVALELSEERLTKEIEGSVLGSHFIENRFRITQLAEIPGDEPAPMRGLVFEKAAEDACPALERWHTAEMSEPVNDIQMAYGYFEPSFEPIPSIIPMVPPTPRVQKAALLIYLHGAGEGASSSEGEGPERAYVGNRVTALSQDPIQKYFGNAAWVLVPQCPTFWMDDGEEQMGRSNESIYVEPLKALIEEFIASHADRIDTSRIVIGGLSNGGFMTVRICLDYPDFFAAGLPCCAPWFVENQTPEVLETLANTPLWFTHSKGDELVDPLETTIPLVNALKSRGADAHMTYFDHVEDLTGKYKGSDGTPLRTFNHGVWIHQFNDFCRTDLDGGNVLVGGEPVGCWEWAAKQRRE